MLFKAILFDLDGTLLDSAQDIIAACNTVAKNNNYQQGTVENLRSLIAHGSRGIMAEITQLPLYSEKVSQLREQVLSLYANSNYPNTRLFAELNNMLAMLNDNNITWGVVTSKPRKHSLSILNNDSQMRKFKTLVSFDDVTNIKPDPEGLLIALDNLQLQADECVYVGDNKVDMLAAQRARLASIGVGYGYCNDQEHPANFDPDYYVETSRDLANIVRCLFETNPQ